MAFRTNTVDYKMEKLCNVQKLVGEDDFEITYTPLKKIPKKKYWFYSYFYPLKQKLHILYMKHFFGS